MSSYWLMKAEPESRVVKGKDVKFSVEDFERLQVTPWEGVRNHEAKNKMKSMKVGDIVLFYHSSCKVPGVAAIAEVQKEAYPDYTAWDADHPYYDPKSSSESPTWYMVDLQFKSRLDHFIPLSLLRHLHICSHSDLARLPGQDPEDQNTENGGLSYLTTEDHEAIKSMALLNRGRLSVQAVDEPAFDALQKMGSQGGWNNFKPAKSAAPKKMSKKPTEEQSQDTGQDDGELDGPNSQNTEPTEPKKEKHSSRGKKRKVQIDDHASVETPVRPTTRSSKRSKA